MFLFVFIVFVETSSTIVLAFGLRRKPMVWCRLLDHCPDALGQHLLCLEDERSHEALDLQESEHKATGCTHRMFELEIGELSCSSRVLMVMYDKEKDEKDEKGRLGSYWRLELIKAMPSTDGWEGQMELVELYRWCILNAFRFPDLLLFVCVARHAFRSFLSGFALEFRVGFLQATPKALLVFLPVLIMNTLGFVADALRLFNSIG